MKIGILTLPLHFNYGGILQAYALQSVLQSMGHEVILLDRDRTSFQMPRYRRVLSFGKGFIKKYILRHGSRPFARPSKMQEHNNRINKQVELNTRNFITSNFKGIKYLEKPEEMKNFDLDAIVVGSDQVWRPRYFNSFTFYIPDAFLNPFDGDNSIKKISYAASFGTDKCEYSDKELKVCGNLLKQFNAISVREDSAVQFCKESFGADAVHLLDPTLLVDKLQYKELASQSKAIFDGKLFHYVLDSNSVFEKTVCELASSLKTKSFKFDLDKKDDTGEIKPVRPVQDWLKAFDSCEYVITDSFHGTIFAILNQKPFISIGNIDRGLSRFTSVLQLLDLEDRLVLSLNEVNSDKLLSPIDWESVNKKLDKLRDKSNNFLKEALENE